MYTTPTTFQQLPELSGGGSCDALDVDEKTRCERKMVQRTQVHYNEGHGQLGHDTRG